MHTNRRLCAAASVAALLLTASAAAATSAAATGTRHATAPAPGPGLAPACKEKDLTLKVTAAPTPDVLALRFTNNGTRACTVDRIPTVSFGKLDGAARPVPQVGSAPYTVGAKASAYATVRTVLAPPSPADVRVVRDIVVAADPAHRGRRITAAALGLPAGVRVYDPVTSLWQPTAR
ncbi:DUF4232 domain-containing protein [Streptomyces candidus]|uniref:DUF4232 domain-containing protein n=1 Tax=Streptomyces candidus TaxID=67283 RepID=A0A7X0LRY1_9ACTN|nr:DUF4232 domain-containing protein [Streptomyces candidus]MBB6437939.1 hypothetical protein [Streptomyces candidus]GHH49651.1 hypothetical protein GCM10018773_45350 [Streptomyces candidus]